MKITAEQYDEKYSVETIHDDLDVEEVRDKLLMPLLTAMGFHSDSVNSLFFDDPDFLDAPPAEPAEDESSTDDAYADPLRQL